MIRWMLDGGRKAPSDVWSRMSDAKPVLAPYYGQPPRNTRFVDKCMPPQGRCSASAGVTNVYSEA